MPRQSKEKEMLELFFNEPTKHWHFKEIRERVRIADNKISRWLKRLVKQKLILRIKPKGRMPYYTGNYEAPEYQNSKRIFALRTFYESGFLNHISSLEKAKIVIIFGSMMRWDWHKDSDIDLFIYGSANKLEKTKYEAKLGREIQLFECKNRKDYEKLGVKLINNILLGDIIKGEANLLEVINA